MRRADRQPVLGAPALLLLVLAGCGAPDLSPQIADARMILDETIKTTEPSLAARASLELAAAERALATEGKRVGTLPTGCLARLTTDLGESVADCRVTSQAALAEGPANAHQVRLALAAMGAYFTVLEDVVTTEDPANLRAQGDALVKALQALAQSGDVAPITRLSASIDRYGPAASATVGFFAERARVAALRSTVRRAEPVLDDLVRGVQPVLLELGDPIAEAREAVVVQNNAVNQAFLSGSPEAHLAALAALRSTVEAMHKAEAASPIRRLYLMRDLNTAMLRSLQAAPSLDELERVSGELAEIATLLETE